MPLSAERWKEVSPSQFAWEREALDFIRQDLPDCGPYRAWSKFEFIAADGSINEVDLLVFTPQGFFRVEKYSGGRPQGPALGLIFLRCAEVRFVAQRARLFPSPTGRGTEGEGGVGRRRGNRADDPAAYHAEGMLYLPAEARFDYLLNRPEAENIGARVNAAMRDVPKCEVQSVRQSRFDIRTSPIPATVDHDAFERSYGYLVGEFAQA